MKKNKEKYIDDGHTIYNMDVDGMPHRIKTKQSGINLSKEERRTITKAALSHYMPIVFGVILCFLLAMILIYFWLK